MVTCSRLEISVMQVRVCIALLLISTVVFGQDVENGSYRICADGFFFVRSCYGIPCHSEQLDHYRFKQEFRKVTSMDLKEALFLNKIPISETDFYYLFLKKDEVDLENCCFYDRCQDTIVLQIDYHITIKIPIVIDGIEYRYGDMLPLEELQGKRLMFKKEERIFRKNRILIETE